jgi:hypothetical protein
MNKPQRATEYSSERTELAEKVLLEVWSRLGDYREHLVLIGGLVPRYITTQTNAKGTSILQHCGTMDVDLGVSLAVSNLETYKSIRETLTAMGFAPGINEAGNERLHSFEKEIGGVSINIDFLTTKYNGPKNSLMRDLEKELRAIQVEGLGLALNNPLVSDISGELLSGGITTENVNICRPIPFITLKALAFDKRREPKDAYDLVYVMQNAQGSIEDLTAQITEDERSADSFSHSIEVLQNRFQSIDRDGPVKYGQFVDRSQDAAIAFAKVQDYLRNL